MKIEKKTLESVLKKLKKVVPSRVTLPILGCVKFNGDGKNLEISATNIGVSCIATLPCEFEGEFCISLKDLLTALKGIRSTEIGIELISDGSGSGSEGKARIFSEGGTFFLKTTPAIEFPVIPDLNDAEPVFSIDPKKFLEMLKRCAPFVSDDEMRQYINGINAVLKTTTVSRFEATDGHRLIIVETPDANVTKEDSFIIRKSAIQTLFLLAEDCRDRIEVRESKEHIIFKSNGTRIIVRKIDYDFPNTNSVIPGKPVLACRVNRSELLEVVKGAKLFTGNGNSHKNQGICFNIETTELKITADLEESKFEKQLPCRANGRLVIRFNPDFLIDAFNALSGEEMVLEIIDANSALKIAETGTIVIVMPLRSDENPKPIIEFDPDSIINPVQPVQSDTQIQPAPAQESTLQASLLV